jgi:hypothetical protein
LNWVGVYLEILFITSKKKSKFSFQVISYHLVPIQRKGNKKDITCHLNKKMLKGRKGKTNGKTFNPNKNMLKMNRTG